MFCLCLVPLHYQHISNLYTVCIDTNSLRGRWIDVGCQEKVWWLKLGTIHYSDSGYSPEEAHSLIDSRRYELEEHRKWFMDMPHASFITRARHFSLHLMKKKKKKDKKKRSPGPDVSAKPVWEQHSLSHKCCAVNKEHWIFKPICCVVLSDRNALVFSFSLAYVSYRAIKQQREETEK